MTRTSRYNDQIPTDPTTTLILLLTLTYAAGQLTTEQAHALTATGGIAELALIALHLTRGRR